MYKIIPNLVVWSTLFIRSFVPIQSFDTTHTHIHIYTTISGTNIWIPIFYTERFIVIPLRRNCCLSSDESTFLFSIVGVVVFLLFYFLFFFFFFYIITLLWKFFHSLFSQTFTRILITIRTETSRHSKFHFSPSSSAHTHTLTPHHRACVFSASLLLRLLLAWRFFVVHLYSLTYCHCWSPAMLLLLL